MFRHPNAHLLGFVKSGHVPAEQQTVTKKVFGEAHTRLKGEGRPVVSRWTAMETNRAIRKAVPKWTANQSLKDKDGGRGGRGGRGKKHAEGEGAEGGETRTRGGALAFRLFPLWCRESPRTTVDGSRA